ncbi:endonuclease MutS2 [Calditerricola satsumensis]|uniref:endonuclease MutS2 n=1 Tax=Calditerricola satsumensis TaxID=373054 RepID=UPI0016637D4E|nr:endonuclease MutS2 [Calditerricola satsumensis]
MDERALEVLEFPKILAALAEKTVSPLGREKAEALRPSTDPAVVRTWQDETAEAARLLRHHDAVPLAGVRDIRPLVSRAQKGGTLLPDDFVAIAQTLKTGRRLKAFLLKATADGTYPHLRALAERLVSLADLEQAIGEAIGEHGEVLDSASPALRAIRAEIRALESRIRETLEGLIRNPATQKLLQEPLITVRNGRYVLPVKQEHRGAFGGIVHDQSASGATLFVEPQAVVALGNRLREAQRREEREIARILAQLSAKVAAAGEALLANAETLGQLDFVFAKAHLAREQDAGKPALNTKGYLVLRRARHPLIPRDRVVPIDVELGRTFTSLVITGPNTGGKTVTLKTIGLLTLMALAGLHIPAEADSDVAVFSGVYADIGDEQSIEQSLSTFSSHMTNIIRILRRVDANSLVLLDELGAGTDPTEGAALATAILDYLHRRGVRTVATTHYSELKAYAYNRTGVMNASVEFDAETLRPTYRLLIGVPGRSNAFAIAQRLGLPEEIVTAARSQLGEDERRVEAMIASLEENQRRAEAERQEAERLRREVERLRDELARERERFAQEKNRLLEKAEREANQAVERARREAEAILAELREQAKAEQASIREHRLIALRNQLDRARVRFAREAPPRPARKANPRPVREGDTVRVLTLDQKGTVLEKAGDQEWLVSVGLMKVKVKERDLELLEGEPQEEWVPVAAVKGGGSAVSPELDLRGHTVEEALVELDQYLDRALMAGLHQVTVIHGKGTGALRSGVQEFLKRHKHVRAFRLGGPGEGGSGVTVVELG